MARKAKGIKSIFPDFKPTRKKLGKAIFGAPKKRRAKRASDTYTIVGYKADGTPIKKKG